MQTIADKIITFNKSLKFSGRLPEGIKVMNPFSENPKILEISSQFYRKYYSDNKPRRLILGINPGRHGAGVTGIPFTDTKRLKEFCGMNITEFTSHEPSSVFVYGVVSAFGGAKKFYGSFYINSICPLGFTRRSNGKKNGEVNYNYYDSPELLEAARAFMIQSIRAQLDFGLSRKVCFCMGTGSNYKHLSSMNSREKFFEEIVPLEHPRFIMQYRLKKKDEYVAKYLNSLRKHPA